MNLLHIAMLGGLSGVGTQLVEMINHYPDKTTHHVICHAGGGVHDAFKQAIRPALDEHRASFRKYDDADTATHIKETQADAVHISDACFMQNCYYAYLETGAPFLTVFQTAPIFECQHLKKPLLALMADDELPLCSVSPYSTRKYQEYLKKSNLEYDNFFTLCNGMSMDKFKFSQKSRSEIRAQYKIPEDAFVIGDVGRVVAVKRPSWIIAAVGKLRAKGYKNVYGMIVGGADSSADWLGPIKELAKQFNVEEQMVFTGPQNDPAPFYSAFDTFAHPCKEESFGIVIAEALACGLPIALCTPYPATGSDDDGYGIVTDCVNGLVAYDSDEVKQFEIFLNSLELLLKSKPFRKSFADAARDSVKKFDMPIVATEYEKIFKALVEKTHGPNLKRLAYAKAILEPWNS